MTNAVIKRNVLHSCIIWKYHVIVYVNLIQIFVHEGVIVSCGMEEASANYHMFVGSQDSRIIDQFIACFWQKLSLLAVTE